MRPLAVSCVLVVLVAWCAVAGAGNGETFVGAHVIKVDANGKRVTIDRGVRGGIAVGETGEVFPQLRAADGEIGDIDLNVSLAHAKVASVSADQAVLVLDKVVAVPSVGEYFRYRHVFPADRMKSALFRALARGMVLVPDDGKPPFVTFEAVLADPALEGKTLDAMLAHIKANNNGKTYTRDQLQEAFAYFELADRDRVSQPLVLHNAVWAWDGGAADVSLLRDQALVQSAVDAAFAAAKAGKLDEARAQWRTVLTTLPAHAEAQAQLARIDTIQLMQRGLVSDPDDVAGRFALAIELLTAGAFDLALAHVAPLRKQGFDRAKVDEVQANVFYKLERYTEAAALFTTLAKKRTDLVIHARLCTALAKQAKTPGDAGALLELGAVLEERQHWYTARSYYRVASRAAHATAKQREAGKNGRLRAAARQDIASITSNAEEMIRRHDVAQARGYVESGLYLAAKLADPRAAYDFLSAVGDVAFEVYEFQLTADLDAKHVEVMPERELAHTNLASTLSRLERMSEAEQAAKKALQLKVRSEDGEATAHRVLAAVALAKGDMATLEKEARAALKGMFPAVAETLLVRVEAARDDWQAAVDRARKAFATQDTFATRLALTAATRGLQAHEALQANSSAPRERLRLVRALADLALVGRMTAEIAKLPADGSWREDGWYALIDASDSRVQFKDRLAAARNIKTTLPYRKQVIATLEARAALEGAPGDDTKRLALGRAYLLQEQWDRALATVGTMASGTDVLRDAREGAKASNDARAATDALSRGDRETSIKLSLAAQATFDRLGTISRYTMRTTRAWALVQLGRYAEAIKIQDEAVALIAPLGNPLWTAYYKVRAAESRASNGTADSLRQALAEATQLVEASDLEEHLLTVHAQSASVATNDGRWADAIEHARKAWTYADRIGRPDLSREARVAVINANMGATRIADAEQLALALLADSRKAKDSRGELSAVYSLGRVALERGQGKQARIRFQELYDITARIGDTTMRAEAKRMIGRTWSEADHDPRKAIPALEQAAALFETLGDAGATNRGIVLYSLASARLAQNDIPGARRDAEESAALSRHLQRRVLLAGAEWLFAQIAIAEKKSADVLTHGKAMLDLAQMTDDDQTLAAAWYALAQGHALGGKDQEALAAYEKFITHAMRVIAVVGGDSDREGFMSSGNSRGLLQDAIEHMLKLGKIARAMEVLDLTRDAQLRQALDPTKVQAGDARARGKLDAYDKQRARVQGLEKQLEAAHARNGAQRSEAQVKALGEQIAKTRKELSKLALDLKVNYRHLYQALALTPDALADRRADLPAGSVVIEYFMTADALYAFVVSAALTQPAAVKINVSSADLTKAVTAHHDAVLAENAKVKQRDKVDALGRELAGWLLEPLRAHIKDATTVIVLPFGVLNHVPFDALVVSPAGQPVRYAIEDFRISVQSKTTLEFLLKPGAKARTGTMLAIANPDGSLPGAQREVTRIVKSLPDARVLARKQATLAAFKSTVGGFRYIHLATHGIVESDPRKSFLKLADGQLTIKDIAQLQGIDQTNELVVLSACETAMEKDEVASDEQITLAVAFAMAGAPSVVASLWEVSDDSTAELMGTFYRALTSATGDRLDALRGAKLNLLRMKQGNTTPFSAPWHWAGFQMLGDYRAPL